MNAFRALDRSELVIGDEDLGLFFIWYGGVRVHIYDESFREVDLFTMSSGARGTVTPRQVRASIEARRRQIREEQE